MYVCICRAVEDRKVREAIEEGAKSVEAVTRACGAGEDCGACHDQIADMIDAGGVCTVPVALRIPVRERAA